MKTLALITSALTFGVLGCSNPYERDNPIDPYVVHKVTFNANGATGGVPPEVISGSWGDVVTLPEQGGLVREGYVFGGWTDPEGKAYPPGSSYTIRGGSAMSAGWSPTYTGSYGSLSYQGKTYKTVVIGTQTWMAENLNYNASGSKCYSNSDSNCNTYGRLYDWPTAMALPSSCHSNSCSSQIQSKHRGVCPSGWHLPSRAEWEVLGNKGTKATSGWNSGGNGTDAFGFSALPGGYGEAGGRFLEVGNYGGWWSSSEALSGIAYYFYIRYNSGLGSSSYGTKNLFSVRCVQD